MIARDLTRKRTRLAEMKLELGRGCPLSCLHCSASAGPSQGPYIPVADAKRLINDFASMDGQVIVLTGGEPLDHPAVVEIASFAKHARLQTVLYTTGLAHGPVVAADKLTSIAPYIDIFLFCLHASNPLIHDRITGSGGSYRATRNALELLIGHQKIVYIHHVPLSINQGELLPLCKTIVKMGLHHLKVLRFVPQGRGAENRKRLLLDATGVRQLASDIRVGYQTFPSLEIDVGAPYCMLAPNKSIPCGAGSRTISVGASLDCYPCDGFRSIAEGAFREPLGGRSLEEFWLDSATMSAVRLAREKMHRGGGRGCLAQTILSGCSLNHWGRDPLVTYLRQQSPEAVSKRFKCDTA